ncbi:hypothetical protein [Sphingobium aquiterrae]|uniref:hypothetical protein n=1 Tax=Sphingobium aquiterrae TaxID=2038656 RepID=UPI003019B8A5
MNDYVQSSEISPIDRVTPRPVAAVSAVQPIGQAVPETPVQREGAKAPATAADFSALSEEQLASAAEYARVHARIAELLADLRSSSSSQAVSADATEGAIVALMPPPVFLVPLPPANRHMVERVAQLAKDMAAQATTSHVAQAHVKPGTVDQILATVA